MTYPTTASEQTYIEVTGGVDTHKDTHTAAALDASGRLLGALLTFLWVGFHDRPGSAGQRPPRVRSAMAISASGLW